MFSDLYKYKTGRLSKGKVQKWIDIIESIGGDIEDGRRWSGERLIELHNSSLEIYNKMMLDITGDGSVGQTYKERNTGRLYAITPLVIVKTLKGSGVKPAKNIIPSQAKKPPFVDILSCISKTFSS